MRSSFEACFGTPKRAKDPGSMQKALSRGAVKDVGSLNSGNPKVVAAVAEAAADAALSVGPDTAVVA